MAERRAVVYVPSQAIFYTAKKFGINEILSFGSIKNKRRTPRCISRTAQKFSISILVFVRSWKCPWLVPSFEKSRFNTTAFTTEKRIKEAEGNLHNFKKSRPLRYFQKISTPKRGRIFWKFSFFKIIPMMIWLSFFPFFLCRKNFAKKRKKNP